MGCWDDSTSTRGPCWKTDLPVVVQNYNHARSKIAGAVHGFVGHSSRNGSISDDGDAVVLSLIKKRLGNTHSLCGRDRCCRMTSSKRIVFAFLPFAESGNPAQLSKPRHFVSSARQYLVRIALMCYIPDYVVLWHIKHIVESHRQLCDTQGGTEVTSRFRNGFQNFPSYFVRKLSPQERTLCVST